MRRRVLPILVLIGFGLMACSKKNETPFEKQLDSLRKEKVTIEGKISDLQSKLSTKSLPAAALPVTISIATNQTFAHVVDSKGEVDSRSSLNITPQMAGRITRVNVVNGQAVKKGQLLVEIDAEIIRKGIAEVMTQLMTNNQREAVRRHLVAAG